MKKLAVALFAFVLVLAGCSSGETTSEGSTITIEHELGTVEVPVNPSTVAVMPYEVLDVLAQLDVEVSGIAAESGADLPSFLQDDYTGEYTNLGSLKEIDMEAMSSLAPDVIFISGRQSDYFEELNNIAPTVYLGVDGENYMGSVESNLTTLGQIFEKEDQASELYTNLESSVSDLNSQVTEAGENALVLMINGGELSAFGTVSRFGMVYNDFGYAEADTEIEDSSHGMSVSYEYVLDVNPDNIFLVDRDAAIGTEADNSEFFANEIITETSASQNGKIYSLNADAWYKVSGGVEATQIMIDDVAAALE